MGSKILSIFLGLHKNHVRSFQAFGKDATATASATGTHGLRDSENKAPFWVSLSNRACDILEYILDSFTYAAPYSHCTSRSYWKKQEGTKENFLV